MALIQTCVISYSLSTLTSQFRYLPQLTEGKELADALEQCMYYGQALGHVGADFRTLMLPVFKSCVINLFARNLNIASQQFTAALRKHAWVTVMLNAGAVSAQSANMAPPTYLLEYPPLATLTNAYIVTLNQLRPVALLTVKTQLAKQLLDVRWICN